MCDSRIEEKFESQGNKLIWIIIISYRITMELIHEIKFMMN